MCKKFKGINEYRDLMIKCSTLSQMARVVKHYMSNNQQLKVTYWSITGKKVSVTSHAFKSYGLAHYVHVIRSASSDVIEINVTRNAKKSKYSFPNAPHKQLSYDEWKEYNDKAKSLLDYNTADVVNTKNDMQRITLGKSLDDKVTQSTVKSTEESANEPVATVKDYVSRW